jgi:signal transduction histidine kinase
MFKINEKNIGNFNLIGAFVILIVFAFTIVLLSTNSNEDSFKKVEKDIKDKFLEDKKADIRFKINNINIFIQKLEESSPQNLKKREGFIKSFIDEINENRPNPITIKPLQKDAPYYKELIVKGELFIYDKNFDNKKNNETFMMEYMFLNRSFDWVIATKFEDNIMSKEISSWKKHLHNLILDNIYVHISLLFFFSISLLLVIYIINKFSNKTLIQCKKENAKRELDLKQDIIKQEQQVEEEKKKFINQQKLVQEQSKMLALGEMLSNLSNQWRQPLTDISKTALSIQNKIEKHQIATNEDIEQLSAINNSALYLSRTIDDFKVFLKADSLKIDFIVSEIIDKALAINEAIITKNKIKVIKAFDDPITIHNLSFGLLQALVNIIYNSKDALKNMPEDERYIFITTRNHAKSVEIIVSDTGRGIPEEIIGDIFKPYFTTKQKTYGTGLGLHMAHNIIEQNMSGKITVQNKTINYKNYSFKGASFNIELKITK